MIQGKTPRNWIAIIAANAVAYGLASAAALDQPMSFTVHQECEGSGCRSYILAHGTIVNTTPSVFESLLSRIDYKPTVYFHSPGGNLAAGIRLGLAIRKADLDTVVGGPYEKFVRLNEPYAVLVQKAICYSACAYAFFGGVTRELRDRGDLGVHQFRGARGDAGEASAQLTVAVLANYLDRMGVDRKVLDIASTITADRMQMFTQEEARLLNIDNTNPPTASWTIEAAADGALMLLSSQKQPRRDGVVHLFFARDGAAIRAILVYQIHQNFRTSADMKEIFSGRTRFTVRTDSASFSLVPLVDWTHVSDGYRIILQMPNSVLQAISQARSFGLYADWPNAFRDVDPSVSFGTEGLRRGLLALTRQPKPAPINNELLFAVDL